MQCIYRQLAALTLAIHARLRADHSLNITLLIIYICLNEIFTLLGIIPYLLNNCMKMWILGLVYLQYLNENIFQQPIDCLKISVSAIVYTLQNNLLYVAVSNLEAATYQVS